MDEEVWKPVVGYEGLYEISDHGRVRSLPRAVRAKANSVRRKPGRLLSPSIASSGYPCVGLHDRLGRGKTESVHRLVLIAFVGPPAPLQEARHLDGNRADPRLANLAWGSKGENRLDMHEHAFARGEFCRFAKTTPQTVRSIRGERGAGASLPVLAKKYGLTVTTLSRICLRKSWKRVPPGPADLVTENHPNRY